ncbi:transglutaminaseTgpA domain-containing protein [Chloroflexota bacterium]
MEKSASRTWDPASAAILLVAVLLSAWRLQATNWAHGLGQVQNVAVLAFGLGLALGYSRLSKRAVIWLMLAYMAVLIPWQLMGTISFGKDQKYLLEKLAVVFGRLFADVKELAGGRAVEDQLFIVMLLCIPFWFVSLYSGYQLTRHANFLKSILPNGALMFIIHVSYFTTKDYAWMFSLYFFLALILLSRLKYLEDCRKWTQTRVLVSSESELDMTTTTLVLATALIVLAWSAPYIISPPAEGVAFWRNTYGKIFSSDRFENLFASVNKEKRPQPRNFQTQLKLGTQTPQGDQVIFQVYVPQGAGDFPRMYWRGLVYDRFEDGRWQITSKEEVRRFPAQGDLRIPGNDPRRRLSFTFDITTDGQTILYIPPQPVWVNQDAIMLYSEVSEDIFDAMAFRTIFPLKQGDLYRASALFVNPTISELQQSSQDYPEWALTKYLQLPEDFSPRIRQVAQEITANYDNPYDKATAITRYLRSEIQYSTSVEIPNDPDNPVDPLEYVLFKGKKGFCNYYASLEVLMLRSVGIPARLAVGYAQGEANLQNSLYVVRERDLHAWSEVYFPDIGWVEFESTANQEALERPETREEPQLAVPFINPAKSKTPFDEEEPEPEITPKDDQTQEQLSANIRLQRLVTALEWLGGVFFILLAILLQKRFAPKMTPIFVLRKVIERSGWNPPQGVRQWLMVASLPPIERHFHSINLSLKWLSNSQPAHVTPAERAWILKHILPEAAEDIEILLKEHQAQLFSPHAGDEASARRAAFKIMLKGLRRRLKISILGYNYAETQKTPRYPL